MKRKPSVRRMRRSHSPTFIAKVALAKLCRESELHLSQINDWWGGDCRSVLQKYSAPAPHERVTAMLKKSPLHLLDR